jgi:alkylation response protein AidB-like acyl-CoA dehydrogenase
VLTTPAPPSRFRLFFQKLLRWTFGILIIFGLGFLLAMFILYLPNRQASGQVMSDLQQSRQEAADLQSKLDGLKSLQNDLQAAQNELGNANLHVAILSARNDVANAQLAMAQNQPEKAHLALDKTGDTLTMIGGLVDQSQKKVITNLESRLTLATGEIDANPYAAQSDLDVLATGLLELESALFSTP